MNVVAVHHAQDPFPVESHFYGDTFVAIGRVAVQDGEDSIFDPLVFSRFLWPIVQGGSGDLHLAGQCSFVLAGLHTLTS